MRPLAALLAALFLHLGPAIAHRIDAGKGPPPGGLAIPSLTHGQMAVISRNLPAIEALANGETRLDMTTWRLQDYLNLQSFACLWGLAPGSVTDEDSPFNECAHAYLAAGQALLLHLRKAPGADRKAVEALVGTIEAQMLAANASLTICRHSDEPFNTNEVILPRWREIPTHPPTAAFAALALIGIGGGVFSLWRRAGATQTAPG